MGSFGGFYKGEKKKLKKSILEKKAQKMSYGGGSPSFVLPKVEVMRKGKQEDGE